MNITDFKVSAAEQVREILASEEGRDWLFGLGQMHGDMSQREERRGFGAREPLSSIHGVALTAEQASIYRSGFERGAW